MHEVLSGYVERGELPGFLAVVERRGETHVDAFNYERYAIFPIASMSKPIAAAAAMILVEEGRLRLDDPLDDLLPELAEMRVLRSLESPVDDTVPANRAITLRDLLTFRLGTGLIFAEPNTYPIQPVLREAEPEKESDPPRWLAKLGSLPLLHQPGEVWMYNTGSNVLGVLIARCAKQSFGKFLSERIFEPLGMSDTGFHMPPQKLPRLVLGEERDRDKFGRAPRFESGGGGLVSTADDILTFSRMMLNHGELDGKRILTRPSVETMTMDHLTAEQKNRSPWVPGYFDNHGWGFGVTVVTRRFDIASTPGKYGWDGGTGTTWRADPAERMTTILLTPQPFTSPDPPRIHHDFWTLAYSAIDD
jgi:CubicO group peptidase (beta-lactamase class C family)